MTKKALKNAERSLKWDKKIAEEIMLEQIGIATSEIVDAMVLQAKEGSFQHGSYLLDRAFGKVRQQVGIDGGSDGAPIVIMPATLIAKFGLDRPIEGEKLPEYVEKED